MKTDILGVKVNTETKEQILDLIRSKLGRDESVFIVTPYSEFLVATQKDEKFREILNSADIALPDGIGILWAARFLKLNIKNQISKIWYLIISLLSIIFYPKYIRYPIPEKISGSEFIWDLAKLASENNYSVFLLGGFGNTPERVGERLKEKFPNLRIAGTYSGIKPKGHCDPLKAEKQSQGEQEIASSAHVGLAMTENPDIVSVINDSGTDFLFVALGPIRQEKWIYENRQNLRCKLIIGLGGTFDYLAQKRPLAPRFWATRGLEWLWRLLTQPWRVGRILKGVLGLIWYCVKAKFMIS